MGCTQSKPSHNSRSGREKRSRAPKSRTSAQPVNGQISAKEYEVEEPYYKAEAEELREMYIPVENMAIKHQTTVVDDNPVAQLQSDTAKTGTEKDVEVTEQQHVGRPLQVPESKSDLEKLETQNNPELNIAPKVSSDTQKNSIHYAHDDLNADKYNLAPSPAAPGTDNGRKIPSAKKSSVYKGASFPLSDARVMENYVDEKNKKSSEYGECTYDEIPVYQQEDIQVHHQGGQSNVSIAKYQMLRESDLLGLERSKAITTQAQMYKSESPRNQDQSKLSDPGVQERRPEVDESRQLDSNVSVAEDVGSICVDARTGEYKFYQQGVFIGYVDKEEALSLANDWPICPGTTASRFQPEGHIDIGEQPSSTMNDFPITSSRSHDISNHQVRRGYSSKLVDGHGKSSTGFSDQFLREQVGQIFPENRGYYM